MRDHDDPAARLLLVEDDPISAIAARRALATLGVEIDVAESGEEALERLAEGTYRVVIADWTMPGLDGLDLCRRIRRDEAPYVYFLLCSARDDRARRLEAFDAGVDDFLGKPLDRDEVRARLNVARRLLAAEDRAAFQFQERVRSMQETADLADSLRLASRRFEDLFSGLPVACFTFDSDGRIQEWNRAAEEAFGVPGFDTLMRPVWEILPTRDGSWSEARCRAALSGGRGEEFDWTLDTADEPRHFACRIIAMRGRSGHAVGAMCANVDVTARKRVEATLATEKATLESANARLHELASKDGLTGLWNRRSFLADLDSAVEDYARTGRPFSLVLLDIDHFKGYNDTYGHPAGDEVLRRFARVLRHTARSYENPARYGGEEFAIVLHNTAASKGLAAAERFRKSVESADWIERAVTCSLGVASVGDNGVTAEALIAAADAALYTSKQQGRNRCTHAVALPGLAKAA